MADTIKLSTDLGIGVLPEYDSRKDPPLYNELARLRAGIRNLASALDQYTGASAVDLSQFSNGYIPFGSSSGLTANSSLSYNSTTSTFYAPNGIFSAQVTAGTLVTSTFKSTATTLGFYSIAAAPIAQPTTAFAAATFVAGAGTAVNDASTFDGYTLKQVVKALRSLGILA